MQCKACCLGQLLGFGMQDTQSSLRITTVYAEAQPVDIYSSLQFVEGQPTMPAVARPCTLVFVTAVTSGRWASSTLWAFRCSKQWWMCLRACSQCWMLCKPTAAIGSQPQSQQHERANSVCAESTLGSSSVWCNLACTMSG